VQEKTGKSIMSPFLSLIMPTRNRAEYLAAGVGFFLATAREDVELIVCDASDTHEACQKVLEQWMQDSRLKVINNSLENTSHLSSMAENWSRALDSASGEWVIIIGDDDICDPEVVPFIVRLIQAAPQIEAVTWHHAHFDIGIDIPREAKIPMGTQVMLAAGKESVFKQATWPNEKRPPTSICSPYHGAVKRDVLIRIKATRKNWFAFTIPDYDLGWSVAWHTEQFVICERPFSITGVCPKSNSYSVRSEARRAEYLINWQHESGHIDSWGDTKDPFLFTLPMVVLGFRNAFCKAHGIEERIQLPHLVSTLACSIQNQEDEVSFKQHRTAAVKYLITNFGQEFGLASLQRLIRPHEQYAGLSGDQLVVPNSVFDGEILRFAEVAFGIVRPVRHLFN
jgi:glycosyltransferase involved in cell wall biosynthesis